MMSVEAILMHFETMFAYEIRLIVQAFHVAVFNRCFDRRSARAEGSSRGRTREEGVSPLS